MIDNYVSYVYASYTASGYSVHTVCELRTFQRAADEAGKSEGEVSNLIAFLADNPTAGDEIQGTGGCRKLRVAGRGKGKSGGYRTITFYSGHDTPVYLITVFSKGERSDLSQADRNHLATLTKDLVAANRDKFVHARTAQRNIDRKS